MEGGFAMDHKIVKIDDDQHLVFGWANVSIKKDGTQVEDHHSDVIDIEDLENAAYLFNLNFRGTGEMHKGESVGTMIESFLVTKAKLLSMGLAEDALPQGWWVGFYVPSDETFAKVKDGTYKMFSIQGIAIREEVE
jgi:hypothetical protein